MSGSTPVLIYIVITSFYDNTNKAPLIIEELRSLVKHHLK